MEKNTDFIFIKRAKRYLGEIKNLAEEFKKKEAKIENLVQDEKDITKEGLRERLHIALQELMKNETINCDLREKNKSNSEFESMKLQNTALKANLDLVKSDMQSLHKKFEANLKDEITKRSNAELENRFLAKKLAKEEIKRTQIIKECELQRLEDAKKLKSYIDNLKKELFTREELENQVKQLISEKSDLISKVNLLHDEIDSLKQKSICREKHAEEMMKLKVNELEEELADLKKKNTIIAKENENDKLRNEEYDRFKSSSKELEDESKRIKEKLYLTESSLSEYEGYKDKLQKKQQTIIELSAELQNRQIEINKLKNKLNGWTSMAKRYVPTNEQSDDSEALTYVLLRMHAECQNLAHKKAQLERLNEDLQESSSNNKEALKSKDMKIMELTDTIENRESQINDLKRQVKDFASRIEILEINLKGQKHLPSTANLNNIIDDSVEPFDKEKQELESKLSLLTEDLETQRKKILVLREENKRFEEANQTYKESFKDLSMLRLDKDNLEKVNAELASQMRKFHDEIRHLRRQNERLSKNVHDLEESKTTKRQKFVEVDENSATTAVPSSDFLKTLEKEIETLTKNNLDTSRKNAAIQEFYAREVRSQREALLFLLGWDVKIEIVDGEERFRLSSLYSTHDGELIFYPRKRKSVLDNALNNGANGTASGLTDQREFDLYFDGHYVTKWETDQSWRDAYKLSGSHPFFLATTCILEMNELRSNSGDKIFKNSKGILLKFEVDS